jgi:hypothetical protein
MPDALFRPGERESVGMKPEKSRNRHSLPAAQIQPSSIMQTRSPARAAASGRGARSTGGLKSESMSESKSESMSESTTFAPRRADADARSPAREKRERERERERGRESRSHHALPRPGRGHRPARGAVRAPETHRQRLGRAPSPSRTPLEPERIAPARARGGSRSGTPRDTPAETRTRAPVRVDCDG